MAFPQYSHNSITDIVGNRDLDAMGLSAEIVGPRSIKISRNGHFIGVWRQMMGSFAWYPAGYNLPMHKVSSPHEAVRHLMVTLGPKH